MNHFDFGEGEQRDPDFAIEDVTDMFRRSDMEAYVKAQATARGPWRSLREARIPDFPFPQRDNPFLDHLVVRAERKIKRGEDVHLALVHLAVYAWFEGGISGYDRGQHDAREES